MNTDAQLFCSAIDGILLGVFLFLDLLFEARLFFRLISRSFSSINSLLIAATLLTRYVLTHTLRDRAGQHATRPSPHQNPRIEETFLDRIPESSSPKFDAGHPN